MAMYVYSVKGGKTLTIHTPHCQNFSEVKNTIREQSQDKMVMRSEYPDGLTLEIIQTVQEVVVYSNRELTENPDGSFSAP